MQSRPRRAARPAGGRRARCGANAATISERDRHDRELTGFDAHVERDERGQEVAARQAEVAQHARKSHPVQQAEREHERDPPRLQLGRDACSRSRRTQSTARSSARRPAPAATRRRRSSAPSVIECASVNVLTCSSTDRHCVLSRNKPDHEQDVIEPLRQDVREAEREIAATRLRLASAAAAAPPATPARSRRRLRARRSARRCRRLAPPARRCPSASVVCERETAVRRAGIVPVNRTIDGACAKSLNADAGRYSKRRRCRHAVELQARGVEKRRAERRDPPIARLTVARRRDVTGLSARSAAASAARRDRRRRRSGRCRAGGSKTRRDLRLADFVRVDAAVTPPQADQGGDTPCASARACMSGATCVAVPLDRLRMAQDVRDPSCRCAAPGESRASRLVEPSGLEVRPGQRILA